MDSWQLQGRYNCFWGGHGAEEVDYPHGTAVEGVDNLLDCLKSCSDYPHYGCHAILFNNEDKCYRKRNIVVSKCYQDNRIMLYKRTDSFPPEPPAPPLPNPPSPVLPFDVPWPPPPPSRWLNADQCDSFWQDPTHRFHELFGEIGWVVRKGDEKTCWDDDGFDMFWDNMKNARNCSRNWYTGNWGALGATNGGPTKTWVNPHFTAVRAPALLGFDENIEEYCKDNAPAEVDGHSQQCVKANVNILALYGDKIPYNVCRNMEWQTCAAMGLLPGQGEGRGGNVLRFAKAPRNLEPFHGKRKIGGCFGYHPLGCEGKGYASSDIFYLEACYYNQICSNSHQMWLLEDGQDWICHFDQWGYEQLGRWIKAGKPVSRPPAPAMPPRAPGSDDVTSSTETASETTVPV
jgi:hypothetical protein